MRPEGTFWIFFLLRYNLAFTVGHSAAQVLKCHPKTPCQRRSQFTETRGRGSPTSTLLKVPCPIPTPMPLRSQYAVSCCSSYRDVRGFDTGPVKVQGSEEHSFTDSQSIPTMLRWIKSAKTKYHVVQDQTVVSKCGCHVAHLKRQISSSVSVRARPYPIILIKEPHFSVLSPLETSQVTSPTSETPEPVAMEPEATTPAAEPGEMRRRSLSTNDGFAS